MISNVKDVFLVIEHSSLFYNMPNLGAERQQKARNGGEEQRFYTPLSLEHVMLRSLRVRCGMSTSEIQQWSDDQY